MQTVWGPLFRRRRLPLRRERVVTGDGDFVDVDCLDGPAGAPRARTFAEYDEAVTAPLGGFAGAEDCWRRASSGPYRGRIQAPVLLLSALDDPLVPARALPDPATLPPSVRAEFSARGGHAGFLVGPWPWRARAWGERRAVEFLADLLAGRGVPSPAGLAHGRS